MRKLGKNALANLELDETCQIDLGSTVTAIDSSNYKTNIVWGANHDNPILEDAEFRTKNYDILDYTQEVVDTAKSTERTVYIKQLGDYTGDTVIVPSRLNENKILNIERQKENGRYVYNNENNTIKEVFIPKQIVNIPSYLFSNCKAIEKAKIDVGGYSGGGLFENCTSLKKVEIKARVLSSWAFKGCTSLLKAKLGEIIQINEQAFYGCSSLTNIEIPSSVTSIGRSAFQGCSALKELIIPSGITTISQAAFCGCSNLANITIPNTVETIEYRAFQNCTALTEITIPNSVTSIGAEIFLYCSNLTNIYIDNVEGSLDTSNFGAPNAEISWLR